MKDQMTRIQVIDIARQAALKAGLRGVRNDYLPITQLEAENWQPHAWVIDAVLSALEGQRKAFAFQLRCEIELDGFGCACEPTKKCNTCNARDTLTRALTPLLQSLDA